MISPLRFLKKVLWQNFLNDTLTLSVWILTFLYTVIIYFSVLVHGGWSDWSAWSSCDCVHGTRERIRKCNNPMPQHNGQNCFGFSRILRTCNHFTSGNCPGSLSHIEIKVCMGNSLVLWKRNHRVQFWLMEKVPKIKTVSSTRDLWCGIKGMDATIYWFIRSFNFTDNEVHQSQTIPVLALR